MKKTLNKLLYQIIFITFFLTLLLSACSNQQASVQEPAPDATFPFQQKWSYQADKTVWKLASNDNSVFVATPDKILALSLSNGNLLWEFQFEVDTLAPSLLANTKIVIAANRKEMIGINAITGQLLWRVDTSVQNGGPGFHLDTISENYLIVEMARRWNLQVYDVTTGQLAWETIGNRGGSGVYIDEPHNLLVLVGGPISPRIFDLKAGELNFQQEGYTTERSAYEFSSVYYIDTDKFTANSLDILTMEKNWTVRLNSSLSAITFVNDMLLFSSEHGLYALNKNGDQLWTTDSLGEGFHEKAVMIGKYIFAQASYTRKIYAWLDDGSLIGTISVPEKDISQFISDQKTNIFSVNNHLLALLNNNKVYVYGK